MDLIAALIWFIIVVVVVAVTCYKYIRIRIWSSITLGLIIGVLLLLLIYPISYLMDEPPQWSIAIYLVILFIVPIYILIYSFIRALFDTKGCPPEKEVVVSQISVREMPGSIATV